MTIESFRLDLLPVWMTEISVVGRSYLVLFNGQNGAAQSDWSGKINKEKGSLKVWLDDLIKE